MKKVIVLGSGMVGRVMAADLSDSFDVTAADAKASALESIPAKYPVKRVVADLSDREAVMRLVQPFDIVVNALPGFMGYATLATLIMAGKDVADISFFPEDPFQLDALAKEKNVTVVMDCGVAPGLCNLWAGFHHKRMKLGSYECLVGGLPFVRIWPWEYKAPFSPADVIEEYNRPARLVENGKEVIRPALSEPELISFEQAGTLEAFNTDGLRSLIRTLAGVPDMKERTLRYPGHIALMRILREAGFFSKEEVDVNGKKIVPLELTSRLLFPQWKLKDDEREFTVMRVILSGEENGKAKTYTYSLFDEYDSATGFSSMSRTTGFTCTATLHLIEKGMFSRKGVFPPEIVGEDEACLNFVQQYLAQRNVKTECSIS